MEIYLENTGKRYNWDWIFRNINFQFETGRHYAITGPNGSGKSTLLQVIAGAVQHTEGSVTFKKAGISIDPSKHFEQIAIAAPYLELIEEMTALELLDFHRNFKGFSTSNVEMLEMVNIAKAGNKQIRYFSSGMKQRLKLAQVFFSSADIFLLDEPTTNLDLEGIELYNKLIHHYTQGKLVIICSNDPLEYSSATNILHISNYKEKY